MSRLILLETTAGGRSGMALPLDYLASVREIADRHGLIVHLDGARLFNASTALGVDVKEIMQYVDSVSICLSKGLCAPVGSVVCGSAEFIKKARRTRKSVGGGMRQAGILAAAGIVALEEMTLRLDEDHKHARQLAEGLAAIPGVKIDLDKIQSNLVFFGLDETHPLSTDDVAKQLREQANIWIGSYGSAGFRAVTHYWVGSAEIELLLSHLRKILVAQPII